MWRLWGGPCGSPLPHNPHRKPSRGGLAASLRPEVALLLHREAAGCEEGRHMLARGRWSLEAEREGLANPIEHGPGVAHVQPLVLDKPGIEVVEGDGAATGGPRDLTQRAFDGLSIQVHRYRFPQEEGRLVRIEARLHQ